MAEACSAAKEPRVHQLRSGEEYQQDIFREWRRSVVRRFYRTRNLLKNGTWPASIWNLGFMVLCLSVCMLGDWDLVRPINARLLILPAYLYIPEGCPLILKSIIVSTVVGFVFFLVLLYVRRYMLRGLLAYRGWMYEQPKTQSYSTILWGVLVKVVSGYSPSLYSCQRSLPRMPVPTVQETLSRLLKSLRPLYDENSKEWKSICKNAEDFEKSLAHKLQRVLILKSWWSQNYVTDWWEKYVYLMGRSPLPINSNYYIMDQSYFMPTTFQTARTANAVYQYLKFKQLIDREKLEPLLIRRTIPVCMAQYERVFSTTRIPGEDNDTLYHVDSALSKHLVVYRKGYMYKVDVYDNQGKILQPQSIEKLLQWIIDDADSELDSISDSAKSISALTGIERPTWAKVRAEQFSSGVNKDSLDIVESAIFCVTLHHENRDDFSSRAKFLMCGDGKSIWFDKSLNVITFPNGRMGLNCEHSYADAPVLAHLAEYNMTEESLELCGFDEKGHFIDSDSQQVFVKPQRLVWEMNNDLSTAIKSAQLTVTQNINDIDLIVKEFNLYGKGFMKSCKISPDAYIQMALQLTYYRNAGKFALTYESSMTRLYLLGRTDTVRSVTTESTKFVRAYFDKEKSAQEKITLLKRACDIHQTQYRDAMNGKAIDRHLFALYVVSKGMGYECDFLKHALTIPWTLSTSQQPQQQIPTSPDCNNIEFQNVLCPGGGFGPVSDDGYGVSYMIPGDRKLFFHVSSKISTKATNSSLFMDQLFDTFREMKELLESQK
ncbi:CPT1A [Mytilus coruscus]|uniref:CPT1A n=1 Tax=Mytilus coruscus TaxID=42192 RepID=A0A6J8A134_MYTCO|nr:CPT1A [Mytilus coruscus]